MRSIQKSNLQTVILLFVIVSCVLLFSQFLASAYIQRIIVGLGISLILVASLNLINGMTGVFTLGQIGFMAIGAYCSAILTLPISLKQLNLPNMPAWLAGVQMSFFPATIIAGTLAMCISFFVGLSLMRLNGSYVSVATMGFMVIVQAVLINWDNMTRGARTFSGVPPYTTLWWTWGWAILTIYIVWRLSYSAYGRRMRACRDNEIASQSLGINVMRTRLLAYCISAFFTAVAGSLWAHFIMSFSPKSFYFAETFNIITMLVIGGSGSISGSVTGAVLLTGLSEILRNAERGITLGPIQIPAIYGASQIIIAIIFILVIVFWPHGLLGDREFNFTKLWCRLNPHKSTSPSISGKEE